MLDSNDSLKALVRSVKYIALDLDGTLLDDNKTISVSNIAVIQRLQEQGIKFIFASGRHAHEVFSLIEQYNLKGISFIICRDGQHIYDGKKKKIKSFSFLNAEDLSRIFSLSNCRYFFCSDDEKDYLLFRSNVKAIKYRIKHCREIKANNLHVLSLFQANLCHFKVGKAILSNSITICRDEMNNCFTVHKVDNGCHDIFPLGVNKFLALEWLSTNKHICLDQLLYFGDSYNDSECFDNLRYVIVMGNAPEDLKKFSILCDVPSNNESGVSRVLDYLFRG